MQLGKDYQADYVEDIALSSNMSTSLKEESESHLQPLLSSGHMMTGEWKWNQKIG